MAYRVKIMPRSQRDLRSIYERIGAGSFDAARAWFFGLKADIGTLCDTSARCPATPEDKRSRHLLYGHKPHIYRVIFRILEKQKQVEVLHIRHSARDKFASDDLQK